MAPASTRRDCQRGCDGSPSGAGTQGQYGRTGDTEDLLERHVHGRGGDGWWFGRPQARSGGASGVTSGRRTVDTAVRLGRGLHRSGAGGGADDRSLAQQAAGGLSVERVRAAAMATRRAVNDAPTAAVPCRPPGATAVPVKRRRRVPCRTLSVQVRKGADPCAEDSSSGSGTRRTRARRHGQVVTNLDGCQPSGRSAATARGRRTVGRCPRRCWTPTGRRRWRGPCRRPRRRAQSGPRPERVRSGWR